jgi:oxygen-independent coproporphyrinogen-3 oxidase
VDLFRKYNVAGPRYTSYPPVPFWSGAPTFAQWRQHSTEAFNASNSHEGISIYLHLPYCESLCTYCGCNKRITKNHAVERPYIEALLSEWSVYRSWWPDTPQIREIHLGGGTPTFFSPENLDYLLSELLKNTKLHPDFAFSFEAHPNNTTLGHLEVLYRHGFRRLSLGIQDFDPDVQQIVNRIQPFEQVKKVVDEARSVGYNSINFDLIYGLPLQKLSSVENTVKLVNLLRPERIAFYSYAHVPWKSPGQRMFTEKDLPDNENKRALYECGKKLFEDSGYIEIGMDHFALPGDELCVAAEESRLHRNFMGYTTGQTSLLVGLGASAISDSWSAFVQNEKKVEDYISTIHEGKFGTSNGHLLSDVDGIIRKHVLNLMTQFETRWTDEEAQLASWTGLYPRIADMISDELVVYSPNHLLITQEGKPFVRNVCMALDPYLQGIKSSGKMFSSTV